MKPPPCRQAPVQPEKASGQDEPGGGLTLPSVAVDGLVGSAGGAEALLGEPLPAPLPPVLSSAAAPGVLRLSMARDFAPDPTLGQGERVVVLAKLYPKDEAYFEHRAALREQLRAGLPQTHRQSRLYDGFVAELTLSGETVDVEGSTWRVTGPGPRGYVQTPHGVVVAFDNRLEVFDRVTHQRLRTVEHPSLRVLHNLEAHPTDPNLVLVTATGAETLLEYDLVQNEMVWRWRSWLNGFDQTRAGLKVLDARQPVPPELADKLVSHEEAEARARLPAAQRPRDGAAVVVDFDRALEDPLGLPKWMRMAQPNWAGYGESPDIVYASFFNEGTVVRIDKRLSTVETVLGGLSMPHGLIPTSDGFVVSDTGRGKVLVLDRALRVTAELDFTELPIPPEDHAAPSGFRDSGQEWIQFTYPIADGVLATVDSRRSMLWVWSLERRTVNALRLPFDGEFQAVLAAR